jgi:ACS family glucarate transporter-like MFS transporter
MRRGFFLLLAGISSLLALGDRYEISLFYRYLMNIYSINSIVSFSYIFLVFYLGYTITQIPGGLFAQKFGPSKIMVLSLIL